MAKKTTKDPGDAAPGLPISTLADLAGDSKNPRKISDEAAAGLGKSLKNFGDLSGIVFNRRTGELVTGHQRVAQIREQWPEATIEVVDAATNQEVWGRIRVDESRYFAVRVVDWTVAKQRGANVAANNQKIAGKFTKDVSSYLLEIESELSAEIPSVFDDCLLVEIMSAGIDLTTDATETEEVAFDAEIKESFQVVVECASEEDQQKVYDQMVEAGYKCRVLTT